MPHDPPGHDAQQAYDAAEDLYGVPVSPGAHSRQQGLEQHLLQEARTEMAKRAHAEARPGDPVSILPSHVEAVLGGLAEWLVPEKRARAEAAMAQVPRGGELQQTVLLTAFGALLGAAVTAVAAGQRWWVGVILAVAGLGALAAGVLVWRRRRIH